MVACKTVGEYKRNQEKIRKFCFEEKAALAKQQEAKGKQLRTTPLQQTSTLQNQPGPSHSVIDTQPLGHEKLLAMAKRNQQAQKRQRTAKKTTSRQPQFSKIDLKYAYSQISLEHSIGKHCNFSILGGQATGTYRFLNGFYGLTDMPATFQKTIDKTLEGIGSKFAFLDDILVITKGSIREGLAINLQKYKFAKNIIEWLGFTITPSGITPLITKTEAITKLDNPKTLKQLRSFLGSVHHLTKFIPNLAKISEPLRALLKKNPEAKNNKLDWKAEHSSAFNNNKAKIHQIIDNKHFDTTKQTRVKCDASAKGLGACIEQKTRKRMAYNRIRQ